MDKNIKKKTPFVVAEIGNNHEGSFEIAKKLVKAAAKTGVSAVKFQTFRTEYYVNQTDKKRFNQLKKFELTKKNFIYLSELAKDLNLKFISTPFDLESANFLSKIVDIFKISSGDNNYFDLIKEVSKFNKKIFISLGLTNIREIFKLVKYLKKIGVKNRTVLMHCVSSYPVKNEEANLNSINYLRAKLKMEIGYSDHTVGIIASIIAYSFGAKIIEKHFTLDNNFSNFRDHKLSLNPQDMKYLIFLLNQSTRMFGNFKKEVSINEKKNINLMRRSFYASRNIKKGEKLINSNIKFVRPFKNSLNKNYILSKKAKKKILINHLISKKDLI